MIILEQNKEVTIKPKRYKITIVLSALILIAVVSLVFYLNDNSKKESVFLDSEAGETLKAYHEAVKGDVTSLNDLKIYTNVENIISNIIADPSSPMYEHQKRMFEEFSMTMLDEREFVDVTDGLEKVEITYEIDVYDYYSMYDDMSSDDNIEDYLSKEEVEIFRGDGDSTSEKTKEVIDKFNNEFYKNLEDLEPVRKKYTTILVKNQYGIYDFEDVKSEDSTSEKTELIYLLQSVISENPRSETE